MIKILKNTQIVNENKVFEGHLVIDNERILKICKTEDDLSAFANAETIDLSGKMLLPGVIDTHVHFREPGLTHKADIFFESRAAVAGGITSFMEMPNTNPPTLHLENLQEKKQLASEKSFANYAFYLGVSNENIDEILKINPSEYAALKLFMGSSTGNMLVDDENSLSKLFAEAQKLIVAHCEDETTIRNNTANYQAQYGDDAPARIHPLVRSEEACFKSTEKAIAFAKKYNTRFHIAHLSTAKELSLLENMPLESKRITAETCIQYLWFCDEDYDRLGTKIKCNPAIKTSKDREALRQALKTGLIDTLATDHAPHLLQEKMQAYFKAPSGIPLIQHSLNCMLELCEQHIFSVEEIVQRMCHAPAILFGVEHRGFIREGYFADLVVVDKQAWTVDSSTILSKCGWSPFEGVRFNSKILCTFVNGSVVYENGVFAEKPTAKELRIKN